MASQFPGDSPPPITPTPPPYAPPPAGGGGLVGRAQRLILSPNAEWPVIDAEPATAQATFMRWAVPLAAIGPVASLIGQQVFGYSFFGVHYRPPIVGSVVGAVLGYAAALAGVWILALVIEALAPSFGAVKNRDQAMKVAAYSYTAAWLAAILNIVPMLGLIGSLLGLYSFYLLWLGLPRLMKAPADKAVGYVIVSVVVAVVVQFVLVALIGAITAGMMAPTYNTGSGTVTLGSVNTGDGTSVNLGALAAAGQQIAANAERTAQATNTGATTVAAGNGRVVDAGALQAMLPASVAGFTRTAVESSGGAAGGIGAATASGTFTQGDQSFELSVSDVGALGSLATLGGALNVNSNKQTATGYERTAMQNGNMVEENWDNSDHRGKYSTMIASRFAVTAEGRAPSIDPLKAAVASVDMGRLASLAR